MRCESCERLTNGDAEGVYGDVSRQCMRRRNLLCARIRSHVAEPSANHLPFAHRKHTWDKRVRYLCAKIHL